MLRYKVSLSSN